MGIVFLASALFVPLIVFRKRREPLVAATGGAYVAFLLHNAIDWDWKIPALTLVGIFCGAATLAGTRETDAARSRRARGVR